MSDAVPEPVLPGEDLTTPEHLLHRAGAELIGDVAGVLAGLDDVQLLGAGWVLCGALCAVFAVLFARQGVKMMRGEAEPLRLGRHYG